MSMYVYIHVEEGGTVCITGSISLVKKKKKKKKEKVVI